MEVSATHLFLGLLAVSLMTMQIDGAKEKSEALEVDLGDNAARESSHRIHKRCSPSLEAAVADCCRFEMMSPLYNKCCDIYQCCPICNDRDCYFKGRTYNSGERIRGVCVNVTCEEGKWVSDGHIDDCCELCEVWDDPHFISYDGWRFDFHGTCNYSITQEGLTHGPDFGVFSDFNYCNNINMVSCIGETTFRDNPNTVITITGGTTILVNGVGFTVTANVQPVLSHDVLAWTYASGGCIRFLGTQRLVVDYCFASTQWGRQIFLYAHPALVDTLYGLCGHFNYFQLDDLTHRDTTVNELVFLPVDFGNSWETSVQPEPNCPLARKADIRDPCLGEALNPFLEICRDILSSVNHNGHFPTQEQLENRIFFCARDLCAFEKGGSSKDDIKELLSSVKQMFGVAVLNDAMTTPGTWPPNNEYCEACNGTCWRNAVCRYRCDSTEVEIKAKVCKHEHCKCCQKKPTCGGDCGSGGTCRSCSCQDDEEQIEGACNLNDCLCCKKKTVCKKRCNWGRRTYPCVPPSECKSIISNVKCSEKGCACCRQRK